MTYFQGRTDLALEAREFVEDADSALHGVIVEEEQMKNSQITVTRVQITTKNGAKLLGKPMGSYITLEIPQLGEVGEQGEEEEEFREMTREIGRQLTSLLPKQKEDSSILVVGLGNREITADALGPSVVEQLCITRHLLLEYGKNAFRQRRPVMVSSLAPGVMAKTGMESAEIVTGIVKETKPEVVIAIDALAARNTKRLNRTIQISNTGIHPGSGVGNHRSAITEEVLGVPVIAIGIPTVVDAATIVTDALQRMHKEFKEAAFLKARESVTLTELHNMYVTAKDIDATIRRLSYTLAEALNIAFGMQA